ISETVSESYGIPVGVYVASISDTGAAYKAGIKEGDIITKIDGISVKTIDEVKEKVNNTKVGTTITVTLQRSDDGEYKEKEVKVTLKSKDTLNGLEDESEQGGFQQQEAPDSGGSEVVPWGDGLY
nr:PDZ domain-containing protein [Eubacterium sp.]